MRPGETLSLTVTLPNEQCIKVPEAVVRWSRGQEFAVENMVIERHAHARLQHYVKRQVQQSAHVSQIHHRLHALFVCHAVPAWADGQAGVDAYKRGDCATALREWRPLAEQGYKGGPGQPWRAVCQQPWWAQDYVQARQWYEKSTAQGNPKAQSNLETLYGNGKGVPQDYQQALRWFRLASNQGNASALITLGIMYEHGYGVT